MVYFPDNIERWKIIASLINQSKNIFISSHINPDGDAIGSEMAFAGFLYNMSKTCRIINHSSTPEPYKFLDPKKIIESYSENDHLQDAPENNDLVVFLDIGVYDRVGKVRDFLVNNEAPKVIIDHHFPEPVEADCVVVNTDASSTGSLVYDLFCYIDSSLVDRQIATALMTAIVTDTGYFTYSNTTSTTHHIAASLYDYGVSARDIRKKLEIGQPLSRQKLLGLTIARVQVSNCGRIAYSYITQLMFEEAGAKREHTDGIINQIRIIKNIKIAMLFVQENENMYKVSFRSVGNTPVNNIASILGGGGHSKAAGANLHGSLEEVISRVIDTATKELDKG